MPASELITLAILLVVAAGTVLIVWRRDQSSPENSNAASAVAANAASPGYKAAVAVLPFEDLDPSADQYFSNGITDEIILQLGKVDGLKVISRTSVVALKGSKLTLPQIADTLGVRHVVEGTVRRAGEHVRVVAQLIDPRTDTRLWSDAYDGDLKDIFGVFRWLDRPRPAQPATRSDRIRAPRFAEGLPFSVELQALPMLRPLAGRKDFLALLRPRG